jgi:hypothetical protein
MLSKAKGKERLIEETRLLKYIPRTVSSFVARAHLASSWLYPRESDRESD